MASTIVLQFNAAFCEFITELATMFDKIAELNTNMIWTQETYQQDHASMRIFEKIDTNLSLIAQKVHEKDETIFELKEVALFEFLCIPAFYLNLTKDEKSLLWPFLQNVVSKAVLVQSIGKQVPILDDIFQSFLQKNPGIKDMAECKTKLARDLFMDDELRTKMFSIFEFTEDGKLPSIMENLPNLIAGLGIGQQPESKDKNNKSDDYDEKETTKKEETNNNNEEMVLDPTSASSQLKLRQKRRETERKLKKLKKKENPYVNLSKMLTEQMKTVNVKECKDEMNKFFTDPETKQEFLGMMDKTKGFDLQTLSKKMMKPDGSLNIANLFKDNNVKSMMSALNGGQEVNSSDISKLTSMFSSLPKI